MPQANPVKSNPLETAPPLPVLLLEDERFDRHRLARMCSALAFPCEIHNATTLEEFSSILASDIFGLILLDYSLPDGTGLDALNMVNLCARNLNTPTLMISGLVNGDVARQAVAAGCTDFLPKDALTTDIFGAAVNQALGSRAKTPSTVQEHFNRSEMTQLLASNTHRTARDIKPMVSRLLRQLRGLRAQGQTPDRVVLQAVEQNCMSLWAFLIELERQDGAEVLANMSDTLRNTLPPPSTGTPRKPPSPFSRVSH